MVASQPARHTSPQPGLKAWLTLHLPALLYAWFWFGMAVSGLLAPTERVLELESALLQEGWHLSVLALCLGAPPIALYIRRMRA